MMGSTGHASPGGRIAIGIIVGLLSTSVQSLGLTLQRQSHILDEKVPLDVRQPAHRRRRWQLGMFIFIAANVFGSSVQISTLPLPVLSTLQASGLVFNSICASLILGEPFTRWSLSGTVLIFTGAVLIAIFGAIPAPIHTLDELLGLLNRRPFIVWMSFQLLIVVSVAVTIDVVNVMATFSQTPKFRLLRGLVYGFISGIVSAHSLLVAKSAVELVIKSVSDRDNQFVYWQSWMLLFVFIVLALAQLYYLHRGLKLVSTSVLYPLVFCVYNIIAILDGLIYFHQTHLIPASHACLIALGTAILLSGVLALSWRLSDDQHQPAVCQSSLTPGLGLVDDTDGEDDSTMRLYSYVDDEDEHDYAIGPFNAFPPLEECASAWPLPRQHQHRAARTKIRNELNNGPTSRSASAKRHRSTSCPSSGETDRLLRHSRRRREADRILSYGNGPPTESAVADRRLPRRRRRTTGFPGFVARTPGRLRGSPLQSAVGGLWRLRWWKGDPGRRPSQTAISNPDATTRLYRDDPDDEPADDRRV